MKKHKLFLLIILTVFTGSLSAQYGEVYDILPEDFSEIEAVHFATPSEDGYFFFAFMSGFNFFPNTTPYLVIADKYGTPVFYRRFEYDVMDFKVQPNGYLTYYENGEKEHFIMNSSFELIDRVDYLNQSIDFHDFHILDNGNYLLQGNSFRLVDMDTVVPGGHTGVTISMTDIQIQDPNQNILWQWSGWDHFEITDIYDDDLLLDENYIDVAHTNAIEIDDDSTLLLSNRNMFEITKIDMTSGDIIWRLGGKNNEFTYTGIDTLGFSAQHDIRKLPNGLYQLFDNGWEMDPQYSSVLQLDLDEENRIAHVVKRLRSQPDDILGSIMGNAQYHDDGSMVVGWGSGQPNITEFDAADNKILEFSYDAASYRAYKFNWETTAFDFNKEIIDFGEVQPNDVKTGTVIITNNLDSELEINRIVSRTGLFQPSADFPLVISAGKEKQIKIEFSNSELGTFNDVLTICNDVANDTLIQRFAKQIPVMVSVTEDAAIGEIARHQVWVYPNPASEIFTVKFSNPGSKICTLQTLDGRILQKFETSGNKLNVNSQSLSSGIIFIKVEYANGSVATSKVVIY